MDMISYGLGLVGMWLLCDGYISIVVCLRWIKHKDWTWRYDHSIRIIRMVIGIGLMVAGWQLK